MRTNLKYRKAAQKNISAMVQAKPLPWTTKTFGWDPTRPTSLSSLLDRIAEYFTHR